MKRLLSLFGLLILLFGCYTNQDIISNINKKITPEKVLVIHETSTNLVYFVIHFYFQNKLYTTSIVDENLTTRKLDVYKSCKFKVCVIVLGLKDGKAMINLEFLPNVFKSKYIKYIEIEKLEGKKDKEEEI